MFMSRQQHRSDEISAMITAIIQRGKTLSPPITAKEIARRAGTTPETLSRMKHLGRGDMTVINSMAGVVGLAIALVPIDGLPAKLAKGTFFDD